VGNKTCPPYQIKLKPVRYAAGAAERDEFRHAEIRANLLILKNTASKNGLIYSVE
jgi:hypothetical protein